MTTKVPRGRPVKPISAFTSRHIGFALALRAARQSAGMSQAELARRSGRSRDHVGRLERGDTLPDSEFVRQVTAVFGGHEMRAGYELALSQRAAEDSEADARPERLLDVVGIGMSNVDFIAGASALSAAEGHPVAEFGRRFDGASEQMVDQVTFDRVLEFYGDDLFEITLGGSSFNAIRALATMDLGLTMGYVSLQGSESPHTPTHREELVRLGVDASFVQDVAGPTGRCVSYIDDGVRMLLTSMGGNVRYWEFLEERFHELLGYLRHARLVHVSSLPEPHTETVALRLLTRLRAESPLCTICVDPGHPWTVQPRPPVTKIFALADYLLLNYREFKLLGSATPGETDDVIALRALQQCGPNTVLVVAERYDQVHLIRKMGDGVSATRWQPGTTTAAPIEDATGAGDVFDAGFIAALSSRRLHCEMGSLLGTALARIKLSCVGAAGPAAMGGVTRAVLERMRNSLDEARAR